MLKNILIAFTLLLVVSLYFSRVDNNITVEDKLYIKKYLTNIKELPKERTFRDEVIFIKEVQNSVLNISPKNIPMVFNIQREPKDIYLSKLGSCVERSRVIEKILRFAGFKTRHIAIYSTTNTKSAIKSLLTPNNPSHAASEVFTKKGWIVIGSNYRWIAIDKNDHFLSIKEIKSRLDNIKEIKSRLDNIKEIFWKYAPPESILNKQFVYVYGLYSRHGKFYPPYNFIPDIQWNEFMYNFTEYFND